MWPSKLKSPGICVLVVSGATFDRSLVPEPATWLLASIIGTICLAGRRTRRG